MTRQLTATAEAATEPLSMLKQRVPKEETQQVRRQNERENDSAGTAVARRPSCPKCSHHWIIDVAIGPLSKGVCKRCGEQQVFRNQLQWAEIAPVRVMKGRSQDKDITITPDQREVPVFVLEGSRYGSSTPLQMAGRRY